MNDRIKECIEDILKFYDEKDFIQMRFAYDEFLTLNGLKYNAFRNVFTELQKNNTIEISANVFRVLKYDDEPVIIILKDNSIIFHTMYKGATLDELQLPDDIGTVIDMYDLPEDNKIVLPDECIKVLGLHEGDIILIEYSDESLRIEKFTKEDILEYL